MFSRFGRTLTTVRFGDVHAFGYNSAESEPIWMKLGALWEYWRGWLWQILDAIRAVATAESKANFAFLSGKQRTISLIFRSPNFTKFKNHVNRCRDANFPNLILKILS